MKKAPANTTSKPNTDIPNMKQPVLILKKLTDDGNFIGFDTIRIWQFNFDGEGTALLSFDSEDELSSMYGMDLNFILCGDPVSGQRCYRPVNLCFAKARNASSKSIR